MQRVEGAGEDRPRLAHADGVALPGQERPQVCIGASHAVRERFVRAQRRQLGTADQHLGQCGQRRARHQAFLLASLAGALGEGERPCVRGPAGLQREVGAVFAAFPAQGGEACRQAEAEAMLAGAQRLRPNVGTHRQVSRRGRAACLFGRRAQQIGQRGRGIGHRGVEHGGGGAGYARQRREQAGAAASDVEDAPVRAIVQRPNGGVRHPARKPRTMFRNTSSWSWCAQWPAFSMPATRTSLNGAVRPSSSGSDAQDSVPWIKSVGQLIRP